MRTADQLRTDILGKLLALGWHRATSFGREQDDVALRDFETAAGEKVAVIYLRTNREGHAVLTGDYWSEGRNVLSAHLVAIPPEASDTILTERIAAYSKEVVAAVDASYARRLHLRWGGDDEAVAETAEAIAAPRG